MRLLGGPMVKLVDTRDLKSLGASCTGSSPVRATKSSSSPLRNFCSPHTICWGRSTVWFITGIIERYRSMHFPEPFGECELSTASRSISENRGPFSWWSQKILLTFPTKPLQQTEIKPNFWNIRKSSESKANAIKKELLWKQSKFLLMA